MPSADSLQIEIEMGVIHEVSVAFAKRIKELKTRHWDLREAIKLAIGCGKRIDLETLIVCIQAALDADEEAEEADRTKKEA